MSLTIFICIMMFKIIFACLSMCCRRFIVLEWLGGGSLNTVLAENQQNTGLAQKFFRKPTFTYSNLLKNAKDMAEALDYLHFRCHPGATIIHRGQCYL